MVGYLLDTKVFNAVLDGEIKPSALSGRSIYVAHTQRDELQNTQNSERREALLAVFKTVDAQEIPTSSLVWGVSRWGVAEFSEGGLYSELHQAIRVADICHKKNVSAANQIRDALLGETAIRRDLTLVANDRGLREAVTKLGGKVLSLGEFCNGH